MQQPSSGYRSGSGHRSPRRPPTQYRRLHRVWLRGHHHRWLHHGRSHRLDSQRTGSFIDLADEATDLAPYHEFDDAIPQPLKDEIDQLRLGVVDGSIVPERERWLRPASDHQDLGEPVP